MAEVEVRVVAQGVTLINSHFCQLHEKFKYYSSTPTKMHESGDGWGVGARDIMQQKE